MATVKDARNRVLFDGTEEDAFLYVEQNFPHVHVEPGMPMPGEPCADVVVTDDSGVRQALVGKEWKAVDYVTDNGRFVHKEVDQPVKKAAASGKDTK